MDVSADEDRQIQSPSQVGNAAFDAVFASNPNEDRATYPDGWNHAKLSELHDAVQQMIAQMAADQHPSATEDTILRNTPLRASSEGQDPASGSSAREYVFDRLRRLCRHIHSRVLQLYQHSCCCYRVVYTQIRV